MQNVEYKAELREPELVRGQLVAIGAKRLQEVEQEDTYFVLPDGRLKRRVSTEQPPEWIFYHRADRIGPRLSNYTILSDDAARQRWGTVNLKPWLTVRKSREVWMLENIRIHLDTVENIGRFLEIEAVVSDEHPTAACRQRVAELRDEMQPWLGEAIAVSYADLAASIR